MKATETAEALWHALGGAKGTGGAAPVGAQPVLPRNPKAHLQRAIDLALAEADGPDDPLGPVILGATIASEGFPEPVDLSWLSRLWKSIVTTMDTNPSEGGNATR